MTGNTQDRSVAFQAAEAGLRVGEAIAQVPVLPDFDGNKEGLYLPAAPGNEPVWKQVDWTDPADVAIPDALANAPGLADAPSLMADAGVGYVVEQLPRVATPGETLAADATVDEATFYRVTSRGVGVTGTAVVTLQTTFKR